jgi:hypothetical protein
LPTHTLPLPAPPPQHPYPCTPGTRSRKVGFEPAQTHSPAQLGSRGDPPMLFQPPPPPTLLCCAEHTYRVTHRYVLHSSGGEEDAAGVDAWVSLGSRAFGGKLGGKLEG